MRCHYEVLGVDRSSDDAAIRSAYRKGALQWHPDKNQDALEEAEHRFRELQNAYEVLSDKHERAWYDSHREAILRSGSQHQAGTDFVPTASKKSMDLFSFFSSSCFSGYNDSPKGFYTVYREVFEQLASQEREAFEEGETRAASPPDYPYFGTSSAGEKEVASFYAFWTNFVTDLSFEWADQFNLAAAPNRPVRRRMEDENRKARKVAKREYNESVRELAAFVRKRDKRVSYFQAQQAQRKLEAEAREQQRREEDRRRRVQEAQQAAEAERLAHEAEYGPASASSSEQDDEEQPLDELYCIACDKTFKSEGAMRNHERSKKHKERADALKAQLEEEAGLSPVEEEAGTDTEPAAEAPRQQDHAHGSDAASLHSDADADSEHLVNGGEHASQWPDASARPSERASASASQHSSGEEASGSDVSSPEESEGDEGDEDQMLRRMMRSHAAAKRGKAGGKGRHKENGSAEAPSHEAQAQDAADAVERLDVDPPATALSRPDSPGAVDSATKPAGPPSQGAEAESKSGRKR
ncbi:hypothetical protein WJX73_004364 [Symbiochloris irregularis]|uniref:Uncharacterized protein n=1 Tax=Symbiochloris irregularis TaxID=706552 RepID=A0AAW1PEV4_9CHLO